MENNNKLLVINGPNLNMLGQREKEHYGSSTLDEIEKSIKKISEDKGFDIDFKQSNSEGEIVSWIQEAMDIYSGLIINAGAYTHTSIAIFDALKILNIPIIEVHLSNIHSRENFRRNSLVSELAQGVICGFGATSYELAIIAITKNILTLRKK